MAIHGFSCGAPFAVSTASKFFSATKPSLDYPQRWAHHFRAGDYQGASLDALDRANLMKLLREIDYDSRDLLAAYLDRGEPGWRESAQYDAGAGAGAQPSGAGKMTEEEAYQILGLQPGASIALTLADRYGPPSEADFEEQFSTLRRNILELEEAAVTRRSAALIVYFASEVEASAKFTSAPELLPKMEDQIILQGEMNCSVHDLAPAHFRNGSDRIKTNGQNRSRVGA
jgi:hypothetical protein